MTTALILAIEPDSSKAFQLKSIAVQIRAELRLADSVAGALAALDERVPDLLLTPAFISAKDDLALTERLRGLGAVAAHIQTLTIPILETPDMTLFGSGVFGTPRRQKQSMGCTADTFAEQVRIYLDRAAEAKREAPPLPLASAPRVSTTAPDESSAVSKPPTADESLVISEAPASAHESSGGIEESFAFEEELPASAEPPETPRSNHPPAFEEFDLDAFMSEEFLHSDPAPAASVPEPVGPALEAPTIMIRRAISTSFPRTLEDLHDFLPEEPSTVPSDASIASEELLEFAPEESARSETRDAGKSADWHALDPTQARFAALLAKLDEIVMRPA